MTGFTACVPFLRLDLRRRLEGITFMREYTLRFRAGLVSVAEGLILSNPGNLGLGARFEFLTFPFQRDK